MYTSHDEVHFIINIAVMAICMVPKLPQMHGVRIFNINKY